MNKLNYARMMESELCKPGAAEKTLLLHACCAPCSSHCLTLLKERIRIIVYYYNPNITDAAEYEHRAAELKRLVEALNGELPGAPIECVIAEPEPSVFYEAVKGLEREPEGGARCAVCFEQRLRAAARLAKERGADYFTTTLTISPLKNAELINEIGLRIATEEGAIWLPSDFKKNDGYKHSVELSAKYGLYRQNYCGCPYSKT